MRPYTLGCKMIYNNLNCHSHYIKQLQSFTVFLLKVLYDFLEDNSYCQKS